MSPDLSTLTINLNFPLPDGRTLVAGPLTYNQDGLATTHNADFVHEPDFARAYRLAMESGHPYGPDLHVEWRVYLPCWAAYNARELEGDFVECGVASGMVSRAVTDYIGFENYPHKTLWLLDTYEGYPTAQLSAAEKAAGLAQTYGTMYVDTYELVKGHFAKYGDNVKVIKGMIPGTLPQVTSEKIAYLMLDLNAAEPEAASIDFFWDRLVPGAFVVLDDYGWRPHINQKIALDAFAKRKGAKIFAVPSGQGLLIKPPK